MSVAALICNLTSAGGPKLPELPDVELYVSCLGQLLAGKILQKVIIKSPFLLRTFEPSIDSIEGETITRFKRLEKKIVWEMESQSCLVFHLMIAGRYHWKTKSRLPTQKNDLAAFQFDHGTMMLTEASKKKRASLHLVKSVEECEQFRRGGLEPLEMNPQQFQQQLTLQNRTLKRALTDPANFSGIGNAYSDEILHAARLSPLKRTGSLKSDEISRLYKAIQTTLTIWKERLLEQTGDKFPEKVRAFRPEMAAHGKFGEACPDCSTPIQRIRYSENECNYCPTCQTEGKVLADRSLSRLLKDEWPGSVDEL